MGSGKPLTLTTWFLSFQSEVPTPFTSHAFDELESLTVKRPRLSVMQPETLATSDWPDAPCVAALAAGVCVADAAGAADCGGVAGCAGALAGACAHANANPETTTRIDPVKRFIWVRPHSSFCAFLSHELNFEQLSACSLAGSSTLIRGMRRTNQEWHATNGRVT